jgi:hypothetical protein
LIALRENTTQKGFGLSFVIYLFFCQNKNINKQGKILLKYTKNDFYFYITLEPFFFFKKKKKKKKQSLEDYLKDSLFENVI